MPKDSDLSDALPKDWHNNVDITIQCLDAFIAKINNVVGAEMEQKFMVVKLKRERIKALEMKIENQKILARMEMMIATTELQVQLREFLKEITRRVEEYNSRICLLTGKRTRSYEDDDIDGQTADNKRFKSSRRALSPESVRLLEILPDDNSDVIEVDSDQDEFRKDSDAGSKNPEKVTSQRVSTDAHNHSGKKESSAKALRSDSKNKKTNSETTNASRSETRDSNRRRHKARSDSKGDKNKSKGKDSDKLKAKEKIDKAQEKDNKIKEKDDKIKEKVNQVKDKNDKMKTNTPNSKDNVEDASKSQTSVENNASKENIKEKTDRENIYSRESPESPTPENRGIPIRASTHIPVPNLETVFARNSQNRDTIAKTLDCNDSDSQNLTFLNGSRHFLKKLKIVLDRLVVEKNSTSLELGVEKQNGESIANDTNQLLTPKKEFLSTDEIFEKISDIPTKDRIVFENVMGF